MISFLKILVCTHKILRDKCLMLYGFHVNFHNTLLDPWWFWWVLILNYDIFMFRVSILVLKWKKGNWASFRAIWWRNEEIDPNSPWKHSHVFKHGWIHWIWFQSGHTALKHSRVLSSVVSFRGNTTKLHPTRPCLRVVFWPNSLFWEYLSFKHTQ